MRDASSVRSTPHTHRNSSLLAVILLLLMGAAVLAAPPAQAGHRSRTTRLHVGEQCVAPSAQIGNGCTIRGSVAGRAADGGDLAWEVSLFHSDQWRVQFQAFSEGAAGECQYPITVIGSYQLPGERPVRFDTTSGFDLGLTPAEQPTMTLTVKRLRIGTSPSACG
jgi:hypothetical protein